MLNALKLRYYLWQATKLAKRLNIYGVESLEDYETLEKLQEKIISLQEKTQTVASWDEGIRVWFPRVIMEPRWKQHKVLRRVFRT